MSEPGEEIVIPTWIPEHLCETFLSGCAAGALAAAANPLPPDIADEVVAVIRRTLRAKLEYPSS